MNQKELTRTLEFAEDLARKVGQFLLENQSKVSVVKYKDKEDILTNIDLAAEKMIIDAIKERFPNQAILSEEKGDNQIDSDYKWIIDPLDGTKHYFRQIPVFNTTLALLYKGEIVLGVSYRPVEKQLYSAIKNNGFFYNHQKISVSSNPDIKKSFLFLGIPNAHKLTPKKYQLRMKQFSDLNQNCYRIRCMADSFMGMGYVARGVFDGFVDLYGEEKPWDVLAGFLFVTEAGGKVTDFYGHKINHSDFSQGIVASNNQIHDQLLRLLSY